MSTTTPQPPEDNKPITAIIGIITLIAGCYLIWQCIKLLTL